MTRINVVDPKILPDQFLMAEYRELLMVMGSARRSLKAKNPAKLLGKEYTLNAGHVRLFYNKAAWLERRYAALIAELLDRGFNIDPASRSADFTLLYQYPQMEWEPDDNARAINMARMQIRFLAKPSWYRWRKGPVPVGICRHYDPALSQYADNALIDCSPESTEFGPVANFVQSLMFAPRINDNTAAVDREFRAWNATVVRSVTKLVVVFNTEADRTFFLLKWG